MNHKKNPGNLRNVKTFTGDSIPGSPNNSYRKSKDPAFIDSLKNKSLRNKWMRELANIIILSPDSSKEKDTLSTRRSEADLVEYSGYIIRKIHFKKLDVYGLNVFDTAYNDQNNRWVKAANNLHIKTSDQVLERNLLFKSGDKVDSRILSDNERLLRELSFIEDARIIINPVDETEGYADVTVIIKDRASKAFYPEMSKLEAGKVELWDKNIFGSGNEFQNNFHWDKSKSGLWGYEAIFTNTNIYGSFIDGRAEYHKVFDYESYGLQFNRKFFTPNTKYAGGASVFRTSTVRSIAFNPFTELRISVSFNKYDFWIGRAFLLNKNAGIDKNRLNLIVASRFYKGDFYSRPEVSPQSNYEYHDKVLWLNSIAVSSQSFYRSSLVYSYGRTEDIPRGYLITVTGGPEFGEFQNRFYSSLNVSAGYYLSNLGYLYSYFADGGFFSKGLNFEQGMYQFKMNYFTNLFVIRRFKYRQFVGFNFIKGVNRFTNESLNLDDRNGIRGFSESTVYGNQKIVINLETVVFTPYYLLGFRFVSFGFFDFGKIGPSNKNILDASSFSGLGIGLRIQNEKLVFPTFELRFAFYPDLPPLSFDELVSLTGEKRLNPSNFYFKNPSVLDYK